MLRSPFPGMDPWIEGWCWGDFHHTFIACAAAMLNRQPRHNVVARIFVREFIDHDVADDLLRDRGICVQRRGSLPEENAVTVIEFPTLWVKTNYNRRVAYLNRRMTWIDAGVNLVEIDLLRTGKYTSLVNYEHLPPDSKTAYRVCLRQAEHDEVKLWAINIRDRLPTIPIPTDSENNSLMLNMQELHDLCYDKGRYDDIDYTREPDPPLEPDDAEWADALLREKGLR